MSSVVLLLSFILLAQPSFADFKICHVSSDVKTVLPKAKDFDKLYGGFYAGIERFSQSHDPKTSILFHQFNPKQDATGVVAGVNWAIHNKCDVVVGLITSKDALIAGPLLKENKLIGFSSTATNSRISQYYPYLMSASTSSSSYTKSVVQWIKKMNLKKVAVISKPSSVYSRFFSDEIKRKLPFAQIFNLRKDNDLSKKDLKVLRSLRADIVFFTVYPIESLPILSTLINSLQYDFSPYILGTQAWMETHIFSSNRTLFSNYKKIYVLNPWDFNSPNQILLQAKRIYRSLYNDSIDHDSVYDFDVTSMILKCAFEKKTRTLSKPRMSHCLSKKFSFVGATGIYHFNGKDSHPTRKEHLMQYDLNYQRKI